MAVTITALQLASHFGDSFSPAGEKESPSATETKYADVLAVATERHNAIVGNGTVPEAVSNEAVIVYAGHVLRNRDPDWLKRLVASETPRDELGPEKTYLPHSEAMRSVRASGMLDMLAPFAEVWL